MCSLSSTNLAGMSTTRSVQTPATLDDLARLDPDQLMGLYHLDYGHSGNPPLIRKVNDEVREVAPGLWLGLAYLKMRDGEHLACFFGIAKQ